jgi:hypothetical protein
MSLRQASRNTRGFQIEIRERAISTAWPERWASTREGIEGTCGDLVQLFSLGREALQEPRELPPLVGEKIRERDPRAPRRPWLVP